MPQIAPAAQSLEYAEEHLFERETVSKDHELMTEAPEGNGWHTFPHTYRSWLDETGAPMKVQQELMRHGSIQTPMNVYGRVMTDLKRKANSQVGGLILAKRLRGERET